MHEVDKRPKRNAFRQGARWLGYVVTYATRLKAGKTIPRREAFVRAITSARLCSATLASVISR